MLADSRGEAADSSIAPGPASGWAAIPDGTLVDALAQDPGGLAHIRFERGVHAFVSASPKRYFIFQCDLIFAAGRIEMGNDVRRVWRPAPSPRYEGFVELTADAGPLDGDGVPPSMLETLVRAVDAGEPQVESLEAAIRALHLGLAVVRASQTPGVPITPANVERDFYVASV